MGYLAARLGDVHKCLQHPGLAVQPPAAPTILIEGQPAARLDDEVACDGSSPAKIAQGEVDVLMQGKPAARFGSRTSHGGFVMTVCQHVLIGRVTAGSKADRLRIRQELIAAAYAKAATMPDGDAKSALIAAADRLARLNVAVEHMRLCEDSYYDDPSSPHYKPNPPEGWQRVDPPPGLVFDEGKTGFHAALYRSEIDGSYVLVFRGTDLWGNLFDPETLKDLIAGNSPIIAQYAAAIELAQQLQAIYGDQLSLAGDSLGGGLATAAAMKTGLHANVFNSVGVNEATWLGHLLNPLDTDNIDSYRVRGEILALLGLAGHPLGNQYPLSPVGGPGVGDRDPRRDPSTGVEWPDRFSPGGVISALAQAAVRATKAELAEAANRHIPETVIDSIEAQKNAAIATINAGIAP